MITRGLAGLATERTGRAGGWGRAVPAWLPAPPVRTVRTVKKPERFWIAAEADSLGHNVMVLCLATALVIGIGYGFSFLVDLVQNWAGASAGVGHLIK